MPPLEAAACGIPVILTSGGSTDDYYDPSFILKIEGTKKTSNDGKNYIEPDLESLISNMSNLIEKRNSLIIKIMQFHLLKKILRGRLLLKII
jgi:glycosyltransferase involved in cell wall biosynthesis